MVGMTEINVREFRDYAAGLAQQAASLILTKRAEITATDDIRSHSQTKTSAVDPVTEVDTAAEAFIVDSIRRDRPDDGIIGEEGADIPSKSGVSWVIDPIDGTVNFMYGLGGVRSLNRGNGRWAICCRGGYQCGEANLVLRRRGPRCGRDLPRWHK